MSWLDCTGHQLTNEFSVAELLKQSPFAVSTKYV
jgi:hypothetical protein